jgi:CBS domain-containing protein
MAMKVKDVMTKDVVKMRDSDSVRTVAKEMRDRGIGDVLVLDQNGALCGIVTDRDIVVRAIATGLDPALTPIVDVCSRNVECLTPNDKVKDAVDCMRRKAIRRVPVIDGGTLVGIVSIGDLAQARDSHSALGEISAAPPNL